jgi:Rhodopirellula transposase DDE domain
MRVARGDREGNRKRWTPKTSPAWPRGKALPYGIYDSGQNRAVVNVGVTHDTAEFAVESIRRTQRVPRKLDGRKTYPAARRLLICADAGGSNGNRLRAWKLNLQQMADRIRIPITVCHYPPGTSKWNKIEHRLFSFISLNWRGEPLINYETIVNLIGATKTRTGLQVKAVLDTNDYETGIKVSDEQIEEIQLRRHKVHPDWNYTISPRQRK